MKRNPSLFILTFEIVAIISLHAMKINKEAEKLDANILNSKNNAHVTLPALKHPAYTLVSIK
jgi:hypothetical protein